MSLKDKKIIGAAAALLVIGVFAASRLLGGSGSQARYKTAEVNRGDVISLITATGTVNPITTIEVGSRVAGTISNIYADFNSEVKKGDPLAEIDPAPLTTELRRAEADNKKAGADFNIAQSLYNTNEELYEKRLIPKEEFDDSQAKYSSALAAYEQSKVALEIAESNLNNTVIRSPIDGVVLSRNINPGEAAVPNGKPLFVVAQDLSDMKIDTRVSEADIGAVSKDQKAYFKVDAYPNQTFEGAVSQIRNEPIINNNVVTYNVVILVGNKEHKLKPGMTAEAKIIVANKKDVLRIPTSALRFIPPSWADVREKPGDPAESSYVWTLLDNGGIGPVAVTPGVSDGTYTEIIDGDIKEGQEIIVEALSDGKSESGSSYLPQPKRF